jgi:hypothetical protein
MEKRIVRVQNMVKEKHWVQKEKRWELKEK